MSITPEELRNEMRSCNGTDGWTRISPQFYPRLIVSNGVKWMCEKAGTYWLMDMLGSEPGAVRSMLQSLNKDGYDSDALHSTLRINVKDRGAWLNLHWGSNDLPNWRHRVHDTDFPEGDWTLGLEGMEIKGQWHVGVMFYQER
jgi:hypothetical protein